MSRHPVAAAHSFCPPTTLPQSSPERYDRPRFSKEEKIENLLAYLNSEGTKATAGQPDWDDLTKLADEYGVRL